MEQQLLFWDIETTGLTCFDQVVEFAAIRTDMEFNELQRHHFKVKLTRDVVPNPEAMIIHRIGVGADAEAWSEDHAVHEIHRILNTPGTLSGGYNTLGFDDEFMRFSFHRHFLPPYTHQYAGGCGRFDLYPMLVMFQQFKPSIMDWPKTDSGLSLKLESLNKVNGWVDGRAHSAMVDVEVTLALAKVMAKHKEFWDYLWGYFQKPVDIQRMAKLPLAFEDVLDDHHLALMVSGKFSKKNQFMKPVMALGSHNHYKNQTMWLDLTADVQSKENAIIIRKKIGEPPFLLPMEDKYMQEISEERAALAEDNITWLKEHPEVLTEIGHYYREWIYPEVLDVDEDAALYQMGFKSMGEEELCRLYHITPAASRSSCIEKFRDPRLQKQAMRQLWRFYPEYLPEECQEKMDAYWEQINIKYEEKAMKDYKGGRRYTPAQALRGIHHLLSHSQLDSEQKELLKAYEGYLQEHFQVQHYIDDMPW
jgi:exodeoxyribonuclease I